MAQLMSRYDEVPVDVWGVDFWAAVLRLLPALCRANGLGRRLAGSLWLSGGNMLAVSVIWLLVIIGKDDPFIVVAGALAVLGPLLALLFSQTRAPAEHGS